MINKSALPNKTHSDIDVESVRAYKTLSVEDKLTYLEQFRNFLEELTPEKNKKKWELLKETGKV